MDLKGRLLANRYEILEKIGSGGMATVYKAKCHVLNRYVAIKILRDEFTTDEEFVKRFEVEAQSAASITHPNIVSVYDVGVDGNLHYIVMELVKGKTLKDIIVEEKGPLPWKWSVNIAIQIASALETAHKNHIIHRDIKPHNIIITEDGVAKVTDFGIAKAVSNSTITAFGTTIGSVHYFSPEQAKGGYTDAKSDIYSLGVVMYEMLTGRVPFDSDTSVSVALKHMQEAPVPPMEINENIPKAVNDIILKAMEKEPMARYQTATAMLRDLSMALKDPDGEFVEEEANDGLTRRMGVITDDMLRNSSASNTKKKKQGKLAEFCKKHPAARPLIIIAIILVLFFGSIGITSAIMNATNPKDVQIPNLVGKTEDEAKAELAKLKLEYVKISEDYNKDYETGKIYEQTPSYSEGYKIKQKNKVSVKVSKGTETTIVPKVIGDTYDDAVKKLEDAKLKAEKVEEVNKDIKEGIVISQETEANSTANAGDLVKIHVSIGSGIPQVVVPGVVGKNENEAKSILESKKLKVNVEYNINATADNEMVTEQSIKSGENVDEGTEITIKVNKVKAEKKLKVIIDIKSLTQYSEDDKEDNKVMIILNNETRTGVSRGEDQYSIEISGNDGERKEIKLEIKTADGTRTYYSTTKNVTFGTQDSITIP